MYKFLDHDCSQLSQAGNKFLLYNQNDIQFTVYKKNELKPLLLTYQQYLDVPSYDIDFSRAYLISLPCGLYRELARHYITYLHACNPLKFVCCMPDISANLYTVNYLAHSTAKLFNHFLSEVNRVMIDVKIDQTTKNILDYELDSNTQVLEFGIPLHFDSKNKQYQLRSLIKQYGFDPGTHIVALNNGDCLLDYRVFGMLYNQISTLFDNFNGCINSKDQLHAQWLKREGEEFYFYHSADELIAEVLSITFNFSRQNSLNGEMYVLCPLSAEDNKFIDRLCYTEVLNNSLEVFDIFGYNIPIKDGNRVIHFGKMKISDALLVCEKIVQKDPLEYQCVKACLEQIKKEYFC